MVNQTLCKVSVTVIEYIYKTLSILCCLSKHNDSGCYITFSDDSEYSDAYGYHFGNQFSLWEKLDINLEETVDCTEWPLDITQKVFFKLLNTFYTCFILINLPLS